MLHTDIATVEYSPCDSNNKDYCCLFFSVCIVYYLFPLSLMQSVAYQIYMYMYTVDIGGCLLYFLCSRLSWSHSAFESTLNYFYRIVCMLIWN